jgi:hypothetical protein
MDNKLFFRLDLPWHDSAFYVIVEEGEEDAFRAAVRALGPSLFPEKVVTLPVPARKAYSVSEIPGLARDA